MPIFVQALDLAGIFVFALSGGVLAVRHRLAAVLVLTVICVPELTLREMRWSSPLSSSRPTPVMLRWKPVPAAHTVVPVALR